MSREIEAGSSIDLYCEFYTLDPSGNKVLKDPDSLPTVSIYSALSDPRESSTDLVNDAEAYQANSTKITTGIYRYTYSVPNNQISNWWFDVWSASIDSTTGSSVMQFYVIGDDEGTTPLTNNLIVLVTLDSTIADTDGNELGENYEMWFTTVFEPMYTDPTLMKLYAGTWIKSIPDETLMLMGYEASKLADDITPAGITINTHFYNNARQRFTTLEAILRLLAIPANQGGTTKQLGDFLVKREGASFVDMLNRLNKEREEWYRVVNAGGNIGPGESFGPMTVVKGEYDPDRLNMGRKWTEANYNDLPGANDRDYVDGKRLKQYQMKNRGSALAGSRSSRDEDLY